jgi:hypothetical protein
LLSPAAIHTSVRSCILDGEMMGYNLDLKEFVSKGESIDIKAFGRDGQRNGMTDQHPSVGSVSDPSLRD